MAVNVDELIKSFEASRRAAQSPRSTAEQLDIAKYILNHSETNWLGKAAENKQLMDRDSSGPSVVSRIFDVLSRTNYAVANATRNAIDDNPDNNNILENLWNGLAGYDKTTFSDVVKVYDKNRGVNSSEGTQALGGLAGDIALDPLTYVGPGLIKGVGRAFKMVFGLGKEEKAIADLPTNPNIFRIDEHPKDLQAAPPSAEHFNLATKPADIKNTPTPLPNVFTEGSNKAATVDIPAINFSDDAQQALQQIEKTSKNMARRRFATEFKADLATKMPDKTPDELKSIMSQWMDENFPKARTPKYKEQTPGFPEFTPTPPVAQQVMKADDILENLKQGDAATAAEKAASIQHRESILSDLGNASATEVAQGIKYADSYIERVLSQPNKFPKQAGKKPSVNNPAQQANLAEAFLRLQKQTGGKLNAFRMIRAAEDHLASKGFQPTFWDGVPIRLTDVMLEMAHTVDDIPDLQKTYLTKLITDFRNSHKPRANADVRIMQTIENLRAENITKEAPLVTHVVDSAAKNANVAESVLSQPKYNQFIEAIAKQAQKSLMATNASPASINAARHLINVVSDINSATPPLKALQTKSHYIISYMQGGQRQWAPVQRAQTKATEAVVGTPISTAAKQIGPGNKAVEFFLTRLATWHGQKDLRPDVLIHTTTATASAGARARIWNKVAKDYSKDELIEGFKVAQNKIPMGSGTDKIEQIGQIFQKAMQNLFDSTGLTKQALLASSVASRSGMLMTDINKQLELVKAPFRFRSGTYFDKNHNFVDYSNGVDWLKSWEMYDVDDPLEFMWKVETAVEQLMHKYAYLDEIAARWGSPVKTKEFNTAVTGDVLPKDTTPFDLPEGWSRASRGKNPKPLKESKRAKQHRLDGLYFPSDIAPQIKKSIETWDQIYDPKSPFIRTLDKVTRAWKSGVTIYAPSHHIRNLIGDVYLSWIAGVNNPFVYNKAAKVIWSQKGRYKDLETVENLVGHNALSNALTRPGDVIINTRAGHKLTAEQIYIAAHNNGLLTHTSVIEELFGESLLSLKGKEIQPFGGKVRDFVRGTAENREHFVRLAHFIDLLSKSKEKNLQNAFKEASKVVRKWHPDGSDLTDFERNIMRRIMPFYSWTRKAIPLMVESAVTRPGKTVVYPKIMQNLQVMMGIETQPGDPFPTDQLFPDWIKEKGIGPILRHGLTDGPGFGMIANLLTEASRSTPGFTGEDSGYSVVNPSTPFIDLVSQFGGMGNPSDPIKGAGQLITPFARIPSEIISGRNWQTDAPIEPGRYIAENIPIAALFSRVSGIGAFGPTKRGAEEGINYEALVNLLTALGLQGTGPYIKTSEFQERDRRREANNG